VAVNFVVTIFSLSLVSASSFYSSVIAAELGYELDIV